MSNERQPVLSGIDNDKINETAISESFSASSAPARGVLITGASRGIGAACALAFAKQGARIAVHYHQNEARATEVCRSIVSAGGDAVLVQADLADEAQTVRMVQHACRALGTIDVLVNNAGICAWGTLDEMTDADFTRLVNVNQRGMFLCCRALYHHMVQRKQGSIVNISSMWGRQGASCEVLYSMTKAAVIGFTRALAAELAPSGVRVNAVAPGVIDTDMLSRFDARSRSDLVQQTPLGRLGTPEDVAQAVVYLASAPFITGEVLGVDGGFLLT